MERGINTPEDMEKMKNITHDVASQAFAHMTAARTQFAAAPRNLQKSSIYAFLSATQTNLYFQELEKQSFEPYITSQVYNQKSPLLLQYNLLKSLWASSF
jgi:hypothetical protein